MEDTTWHLGPLRPWPAIQELQRSISQHICNALLQNTVCWGADSKEYDSMTKQWPDRSSHWEHQSSNDQWEKEVGRSPNVTKAGNTRKPDVTRGQCKTGNMKHTQSVKIQKYTRKEWEAKALVGSKGIENQEAQMGHHASFDAKFRKT